MFATLIHNYPYTPGSPIPTFLQVVRQEIRGEKRQKEVLELLKFMDDSFKQWYCRVGKRNNFGDFPMDTVDSKNV